MLQHADGRLHHPIRGAPHGLQPTVPTDACVRRALQFLYRTIAKLLSFAHDLLQLSQIRFELRVRYAVVLVSRTERLKRHVELTQRSSNACQQIGIHRPGGVHSSEGFIADRHPFPNITLSVAICTGDSDEVHDIQHILLNCDSAFHRTVGRIPGGTGNVIQRFCKLVTGDPASRPTQNGEQCQNDIAPNQFAGKSQTGKRPFFIRLQHRRHVPVRSVFWPSLRALLLQFPTNRRRPDITGQQAD